MWKNFSFVLSLLFSDRDHHAALIQTPFRGTLSGTHNKPLNRRIRGNEKALSGLPLGATWISLSVEVGGGCDRLMTRNGKMLGMFA